MRFNPCAVWAAVLLLLAAACAADEASPPRPRAGVWAAAAAAHSDSLEWGGVRGGSGGGWPVEGDGDGDTEYVTAQTALGAVRGVRMAGKGVDKFLGVPFALPPLPPRRFKAPEPAGPWEGEWDATRLRKACMQSMPNPVKGHDSEDCLYLNIFRPSTATADRPLPVMVWMHGGAFQLGSAGGYPATGLVRKASRDVIVVTVAYRLGTLGFFTLRGLEQHSNAAFLDLTMGLQWVHEHIAAFGGDPSRVMLFGESAGAGCVSMVMCMRRAWPFFHSAVVQSGVGGGDPVDSQYPESLAVAARVGCADAAAAPDDIDAEAVLECLQHAEVEAVLDFSGPVFGVPELPVSPEIMWMKGFVKDVPTVIGVNELEGAFMIDYWLKPFDHENGAEITERQYEVLLRMFFPEEEERDFVTELYGEERAEHGNRAALAHAVGDMHFCSWLWYQNGTEYTASPWYQYVFSQRSARTGLPATHFSEVPYVFGWLPDERASPNAVTTEHMVIEWWTALAATGDPNNALHAPLHWPPYVPGVGGPATIMNITSSPSLLSEFNAYYCNAWYDYRHKSA